MCHVSTFSLRIAKHLLNVKISINAVESYLATTGNRIGRMNALAFINMAITTKKRKKQEPVVEGVKSQTGKTKKRPSTRNISEK